MLRTTRTATALLAAAAAIATSAAVASPAAAHPNRGCVVYTGITETVVELTIDNQGSPAYEVGDGAVFTDEWRNANGELLATLHGSTKVIRINPDNQHLIGFYQESVSLDRGTIRTAGVVDLTDSTNGIRQSVAAFGTGGAYTGKVGNRTYQLVQPPRTYDSSLRIC